MGLTPLGEAAVRALVRERVLIDLSHASEAALDDTFELLDELDPQRRVPVLSSHGGCRFGARSTTIATTRSGGSPSATG